MRWRGLAAVLLGLGVAGAAPGGYNGLASREAYYRRALDVLT